MANVAGVMSQNAEHLQSADISVPNVNTTAKPSVSKRASKKAANVQAQIDAAVAAGIAKALAAMGKSANQTATPVEMTAQAAKVVATLAKYSAKDAETKVFRDADHPRIRFMKGDEKWNDSAKIVPEATVDMPSNLLLFRGVWKKGMSIRDVQEQIGRASCRERV